MSGAYNACWYFGAIANAWTVFGVYHDREREWSWRFVLESEAPLAMSDRMVLAEYRS
jgi:hypothetical protein